MTKKRIIVSVSILILITGIAFTWYVIFSFYKVKEFNVEDFKQEMNDFSSDKIMGEIANQMIARKKAKEVWKELFSCKVVRKVPYIVYFDKKNEVWLVRGNINYNYILNEVGGLAHIIMRKNDGKVLAVWCDK
jgi:hypothetical protein